MVPSIYKGFGEGKFWSPYWSDGVVVEGSEGAVVGSRVAAKDNHEKEADEDHDDCCCFSDVREGSETAEINLYIL